MIICIFCSIICLYVRDSFSSHRPTHSYTTTPITFKNVYNFISHSHFIFVCMSVLYHVFLSPSIFRRALRFNKCSFFFLLLGIGVYKNSQNKFVEIRAIYFSTTIIVRGIRFNIQMLKAKADVIYLSHTYEFTKTKSRMHIAYFSYFPF